VCAEFNPLARGMGLGIAPRLRQDAGEPTLKNAVEAQGKHGGAPAKTKKKQNPRSRCSFGMTAVLRWEENFPRAPHKARAPWATKHEAQALVGAFQI
jgi:hypothetical protein